jgi:hypothetical protein
MMKSQKNRTRSVWLRLPGYQVVALKPELGEHVNNLERAIREGTSADPDLARTDFYDVALEEGTAYICVFRGAHKVYLVALSPSARIWRSPESSDGRRIPEAFASRSATGVCAPF